MYGSVLDLAKYHQGDRSGNPKIIDNGAVISPFPPQTRPLRTNFYKRNALMSAWSWKVLVVEAGVKSGALMTAKFAGEQKRTLLAVPNNIYSPESTGTNKLISRGAEIFLAPDQLLPAGFEQQAETPREKPVEKTERQTTSEQLPPLEKQIIDRLKKPQDVEQLADIFDGNMSALLDTLCTMELEGKIIISHGKMVSA